MRTLLLALTVLSGCGTQRRGAPIAGPLPLDAEQQRGQVVFMRNCEGCHPGGEAGLGPALTSSPAPVWLSKQQIRLGAGAMPRFDRQELSGDDVHALAEFLRALRHHRPPRSAVEPRSEP